jgi:nucleotide-binding universal stress UspA family protein
MNVPKYKLLVLIDLSEAGTIALENAVNLSKIIGGSIEVFHVIKSSSIKEHENQHTTMRNIDEVRVQKKAQLKEIARTVAKKSNAIIRTNCVLGNLKDETLARIKAVQPNIIVLGKRPRKWIDFLGDNFTRFIVKSFKGSVLISGKEASFRPSEIRSLGMLNTTAAELPTDMANDLQKYLKKPIKRFSIHTEGQTMQDTAENVITFAFENGSNTMNHIANYVAKNDIGLLCFNPHNKKASGRLKSLKSNIKGAVRKFNVPILIVNSSSSIQLQ